MHQNATVYNQINDYAPTSHSSFCTHFLHIDKKGVNFLPILFALFRLYYARLMLVKKVALETQLPSF